MNPDYLWLTGLIELLVLFVAGPALAIAVGYGAWRGKPTIFNLKRSRMVCHRVRRKRLSAIRIREVDERRCKNLAVFPAICVLPD